MSKKTSAGAISKMPSAAVSPAAKNAQKSSISKSAFAPSQLQLTLFASVIQAFDSQHLRIHDTRTSRLLCEHAPGPGIRITSLDWGYYGISYRDSLNRGAKKRKRPQHGAESTVVAFGTNRSEICMFSPTEAKVVGKLSGGHARSVRDFKFYQGDYLEGWSIGEDGKLVQWDLQKDRAIRTITLPDPNISSLASPAHINPEILCASSTPFAVDASSEDVHIQAFDSFKNQVHTIIRSGIDQKHPQESFLAMDHDRYINIFDMEQKKLRRTLISGSEVESADFFSPPPSTKDVIQEQLLAVVTRSGAVELFAKPFAETLPPVNGDTKSKRKGMTRKANASVKIIHPTSDSKRVSVFSASLQGPDLVLATTDGGVEVTFQKLRWQDEGNGALLFEGLKEIVPSKTASNLKSATMNGVKEIGKSYVDESHAIVVDGAAKSTVQNAAIEISSSADEQDADSDESSGSEADAGAAVEVNEQDSQESESESDEQMEDAVAVLPSRENGGVSEHHKDGGDVEPQELSFGELLAAENPTTISIADGLQADVSALAPATVQKSLVVPTGISLTTVLSQSLRTNDLNLLESCLHNTDTEIIKLTIQRLDSSLAGILIQKLAELLSSRPGRYGHLITWVQWICVAHGGVLAGRPEVKAKIQTLYKVLTQRSRNLESLLLLKGKLDMLDAQLTYRKELQAQRSAKRDPNDMNDIIYIEGQKENWSSDEDEAADSARPSGKDTGPRKALDDVIADVAGSEDNDDDEDLPMTNGVLHSGSEEDDVSDDEVPRETIRGGLLDDEAEESNNDSHPSDNEENSEEEDSDDADSEMDDFINDDDSISEVEDEGSIDIDTDGDDTPLKPPPKKVRR